MFSRLFTLLSVFFLGNFLFFGVSISSTLQDDSGLHPHKRQRGVVEDKNNKTAKASSGKQAFLISLPNDILIILAKYLRVKDGLRLSAVCRRLRFLSNNETLWQHYVMRIPGWVNYVKHYLYKDDEGKIREKPESEILCSRMLFQKLIVPQIKSIFKESDLQSFPKDSHIRLKKLSCDGSIIHGYHLSRDYFHFFTYQDGKLQFSIKPLKDLHIEVEEGCNELPIVTRDSVIIHTGESEDSDLGAGLRVFHPSHEKSSELFPLEDEDSNTFINDSNKDGSIIVGKFSGKPAIWRNATLEYLPLPTSVKSVANNSNHGDATFTNADGTVIVGFWKGRSILWRNNQPRFFDIEKYFNFIPNAISNDGSKVGMVNKFDGSRSLIFRQDQDPVQIDPLKHYDGNVICSLNHDGCIGIGYSRPNGHALVGLTGLEDCYVHNSEIFLWYESLGTIGFKDLFSFLLYEKFDFHNFRDMSLDGTTFIGPFYSLQRGEIDRFWRAYVPDYNALHREGIVLPFLKNLSNITL